MLIDNKNLNVKLGFNRRFVSLKYRFSRQNFNIWFRISKLISIFYEKISKGAARKTFLNSVDKLSLNSRLRNF